MKDTDFEVIAEIAKEYYSTKKLSHAEKVLEYVMVDSRFELMNEDQKWMVMSIALSHDLIEDTKCPWSVLRGAMPEDNWYEFYTALDLLTHRKLDMSYGEYIDTIIRSKNLYAIMVKQADMKDHLVKRATLSKGLKEKYIPILPKLLNA